MPRAESKSHLGTQFYHSQFPNAQYLSDPSSAPVSPVSNQQPAPAAPSVVPSPKKRHVCAVCDRAFTTSGHLARHSRVHTGERNHKCPFPGCETRCSRQDNLQQHYRIHLSPGSRRSSTRSSAMRNAKRGSTASSTTPSVAPSLSSPPPALESSQQQRIYSHHSTPPDSPPPLAQATLPATASLPTMSNRSSPSASPETQYESPNHSLVPINSQTLSMNAGNSQNYSQYRSGNSYADNGGFTYIHSPSTQSSNPYPSYSNTQHDTYNGQQQQHQQQPPQHLQQQSQHHHQQHHQYQTQTHVQQRDNSPNSVSSRHSISHISHPQTNYHPQASSPASPASSHSVSSHTSGPPTPTYPVFHDDAAHAYHHNSAMLAEQHHPGINGAAHLMHGGYSTGGNGGHGGHAHGRFDSPPPILAPIQDGRLLRARDERQVHAHAHHTSPYIHHPQPLATDYPYHQSLGLSHGAWKGDGGMRKNVATALV